VSVYKIADGHDVAAESLNTLDPQPHSEGIQYGREVHPASGAYFRDAPHAVWEFSVLEDGQLSTLLTAMGLASADFNAVTIYTRGDRWNTWVRMNGTIWMPRLRQDNYFLRNMRFVIRDLAAAS
jgi:hypothetical protein